MAFQRDEGAAASSAASGSQPEDYYVLHVDNSNASSCLAEACVQAIRSLQADRARIGIVSHAPSWLCRTLVADLADPIAASEVNGLYSSIAKPEELSDLRVSLLWRRPNDSAGAAVRHVLRSLPATAILSPTLSVVAG